MCALYPRCGLSVPLTRTSACVGSTLMSYRWWRYSPLENLRQSNSSSISSRSSNASSGYGRGGYQMNSDSASMPTSFGSSSPPRRSSSTKCRSRHASHTSEHPSSGASASSLTGEERPLAGGARLRPLAADAQQRKERELIFPETLPSGRSAQQYTVSQRLFYASHRHALEEVEAQLLMDRRLEKETRLLSKKSAFRDNRFFRKWRDYREIQDPDPLRGEGKLFTESKAASQLRIAAWQKQFEEENEDVFLPYERTSTLKRLAPNWFVRYFVRLRDTGGADHLYHLVLCGTATFSLLLLVGWLFYTAPSRARPLREIR